MMITSIFEVVIQNSRPKPLFCSWDRFSESALLFLPCKDKGHNLGISDKHADKTKWYFVFEIMFETTILDVSTQNQHIQSFLKNTFFVHKECNGVY